MIEALLQQASSSLLFLRVRLTSITHHLQYMERFRSLGGKGGPRQQGRASHDHKKVVTNPGFDDLKKSFPDRPKKEPQLGFGRGRRGRNLVAWTCFPFSLLSVLALLFPSLSF